MSKSLSDLQRRSKAYSDQISVIIHSQIYIVQLFLLDDCNSELYFCLSESITFFFLL